MSGDEVQEAKLGVLNTMPVDVNEEVAFSIANYLQGIPEKHGHGGLEHHDLAAQLVAKLVGVHSNKLPESQ